MNTIHNSAVSYYRNPLGAVPSGSRVTLRLKPSGTLTSIEADVSIILDREGEIGRFPMEKHGEVFEGVLEAPTEPKLYYYYFEIKSEDGISYIGCDSYTGTGCGIGVDAYPKGFQLTVYDESFSTPDWSKNGIMYQIFPDRFRCGDEETFKRGVEYHRNKGRRVIVHSSWNERPISKAVGGYENYDPVDYFGGNLKGIMDRIPYLQSMGVNVIYLNPIVEAASNHRYNTGDYYMVDPILGTMDDFKKLCKAASDAGIKIILDGVYSHTGSDSRYFNKDGRYDECGAYQDGSSRYASWYKFGSSRDEYDCWWGFKSLPEVNEFDPNWQDTVVSGKDSVMKFWLRNGGNGFRLDVADELPDEVIDLMRTSVKEESPDNLLLGEVWEDATTKVSYGKKREYCMGRGLDCIMNYPLRKSIIDFLLQHIHGAEFATLLESQQNNYPKEMYYSQMNLLSSHDVARIKTVLGTDKEGDGMSRDEQGRKVLTIREEKKGIELSKLAYALTFSLPGMPCIYYGDEQGMEGFKDPFNREPFVEKDLRMKRFIEGLGQLRANTPALRTGACGFTFKSNNAMVILRYILDGEDTFGKRVEDGVYLIGVNPTALDLTFNVDIHEIKEGLSPKDLEKLDGIAVKGAAVVSGESTISIAEDGVICVKLKSRSYAVIEVGYEDE